MILIIQIYIYLEEDTNTCENLKQSIPWKKLKIDRHMYIIIYTNLELKTKYLYKNKWKQKLARLRGSRSSLLIKRQENKKYVLSPLVLRYFFLFVSGLRAQAKRNAVKKKYRKNL